VAINDRGEKLGKQTYAPAIPSRHVVETLCQVLMFLNQPLPESVTDAGRDELLAWAAARWNRAALPGTTARQAPAGFQHATQAGL
jgi:glutamyl-Q tRNA(Asp) synthetase